MTPRFIERRRPAWLALSEFYTEPQPKGADFLRIADILRNQGISFAEAEEINRMEVAPAFIGSIIYAFYPPFMWGVEDDDLFAAILAKYDPKRPPTLLFSTRLWGLLVQWEAGRHLRNLRWQMA